MHHPRYRVRWHFYNVAVSPHERTACRVETHAAGIYQLRLSSVNFSRHAVPPRSG